MKGIKKKIVLSSRNYRLDIPVIIMKGMRWKDDLVEIIPHPINNTLTIKNTKRKPVGIAKFRKNIKKTKWIKNKQKKKLRGKYENNR